MTYQEAADKLAGLQLIAETFAHDRIRLADGDAEALRLAVEVLRRENEIREMDPWEGK